MFFLAELFLYRCFLFEFSAFFVKLLPNFTLLYINSIKKPQRTAMIYVIKISVLLTMVRKYGDIKFEVMFLRVLVQLQRFALI